MIFIFFTCSKKEKKKEEGTLFSIHALLRRARGVPQGVPRVFHLFQQ